MLKILITLLALVLVIIGDATDDWVEQCGAQLLCLLFSLFVCLMVISSSKGWWWLELK